jgi:hypothetical protein
LTIGTLAKEELLVQAIVEGKVDNPMQYQTKSTSYPTETVASVHLSSFNEVQVCYFPPQFH